MELMRKCWILVLFFSVQVPVQATQLQSSELSSELSADEMLALITADLKANRFDSPGMTSAMYRIDQFRQQWPYDFRVVPLAYQWAEASRRQAEVRLEQGDHQAARQIAEQLWALVPLTPGLEDLQQQLDLKAPAQDMPADALLASDVLIPDYVQVDAGVHRQFRNLEDDNSPALASLELDAEMVDDRNSDIEDVLRPICEAAVAREASAIVHAEDRVDYRWLMVRLTLCVRRVDREFRLRHSFRQIDGSPAITLHPPRAAILSLD